MNSGIELESQAIIYTSTDLDTLAINWKDKSIDEKNEVYANIIQLYSQQPNEFQRTIKDLTDIAHRAAPENFIRSSEPKAIFSKDIFQAFVKHFDYQIIQELLAHTSSDNKIEIIKNELNLSKASQLLLSIIKNNTPSEHHDRLASQVMIRLIGPLVILEINIPQIPQDARDYLIKNPDLLNQSAKNTISNTDTGLYQRFPDITDTLKNPNITALDKLEQLTNIYQNDKNNPIAFAAYKTRRVYLCESLKCLYEMCSKKALAESMALNKITKDLSVGREFLTRNTALQLTPNYC